MNVRLINKGNERLQTGMLDESGIPVIRMEDLSKDTRAKVFRFLHRERVLEF